MKQQKAIIEQFKQLYGNPTLSEIEKLTGIQRTRFFRISHGMDMRLDEFIILKDLIEKKVRVEDHFGDLINNCRQEMNREQLLNLETLIHRHLQKCIYANDLNNSIKMEVYSA